jgi:hypothetical protein
MELYPAKEEKRSYQHLYFYLLDGFEQGRHKDMKKWQTSQNTIEDYGMVMSFAFFGEEYLKFKHFFVTLIHFIYQEQLFKLVGQSKEAWLRGEPRMGILDFKITALTLWMKK